jgi:hypothetical protein
MGNWKKIVTQERGRKKRHGSLTPGRVRWRRRVRIGGRKIAQEKRA